MIRGEDNPFPILDKRDNKHEAFKIQASDQMSLEDGSLLMSWHEVERGKKLDYATAVMPGYQNVFNLQPNEAWELFDYKNQGKKGEALMYEHINPGSPTLLLPLQGGVCPYDCKGCPFARNAPETEGKQTKQLGPDETRILIQQSLSLAKKNNIDTSDIGVSFVGSGDATPNMHLEKIFQMIQAEFPQVVRVRFSTVAGMASKEHSTPMQVVSRIIERSDYNGNPKISIQVSVHNTDEDHRAAHVYDQSIHPRSGENGLDLNRAKRRLLPLGQVANQFEEIIKVQEKKGFKNIRKPSLTFVCTKDSNIEVSALSEHGFKPSNTVIQLRPIFSDNQEDCMGKEKFFSTYNELRATGFDVVIMPVTPSGVELMSAEKKDEATTN